jgi:hypothetical protein
MLPSIDQQVSSSAVAPTSILTAEPPFSRRTMQLPARLAASCSRSCQICFHRGRLYASMSCVRADARAVFVHSRMWRAQLRSQPSSSQQSKSRLHLCPRTAVGKSERGAHRKARYAHEDPHTPPPDLSQPPMNSSICSSNIN